MNHAKRALRIAALLLVIGVWGMMPWRGVAAEGTGGEFKPFAFVMLGDPQYSFTNGPGELRQSLERFKSIARMANTLKVPFALIPGDLVNDLNKNESERAVEADFFAQGMKELQVPSYLIPGNHDIYNPQTLLRYRQEHGKDYYSFTCNNCDFICLNSVTLREPATYPVEARTQMEWLKQALTAARAARRDHVFVMLHHPPLESVDEVSIPMPMRRQLVQLFLEYGVDAILAGHVHTNQEVATWGGIPIYTVAGTATINDHDPRMFGYRVFVVSRHDYRQFYVQLGKEILPPQPPLRPQLSSVAGEMLLTWTDPASSPGALSYRVWRDGKAVAETVEPHFSVPRALTGTQAYQVSAIGLTGKESAPSLPLSPGTLQEVRLVGPGDAWRAWDQPIQLSYDWRFENFNDSTWKRGRTPLMVPGQTTPMVWLRRTFPVKDTATLRGAVLRIQATDGAVAYLNGKEVLRTANVPRGMATLGTRALAPASGTAIEVQVNPELLATDSTNTLAVQLFQAAGSGATLTLDLSLTAFSDPQAARVVRGPYLQAGGESRVVVRWRTDRPTLSHVLVGEKADSLTRQVDETATTTEHIIPVSGLKPGTRYYYAVTANGSRAIGGESYNFITAPAHGTAQPTRIWAIGDSGTANATAAAVRDAYLGMTQNIPTNVWLMLGDNAYPNGTDAQHQAAVFEMFPRILRSTLLYTCPGNHEYFSTNQATGRPVYYDIFTAPTQAEAGGEPSGDPAFYSFDYGNIHFISLDSQGVNRQANGPMMTWLKKDVAAAKAQRWMIAFFHHPPYSKGGHDSDKLDDEGDRMLDMRQVALPILEDGGVDLVLSGHSHSYERSYMVDGFYGLSTTLRPEMMAKSSGNFRLDGPYLKPTLGLAPHEGTVYTVMGSSGQVTKGPLNHPVMNRSFLESGSLVIDVEGQWLAARFIGVDGRMRDSFSIMKGSSQNQILKK